MWVVRDIRDDCPISQRAGAQEGYELVITDAGTECLNRGRARGCATDPASRLARLTRYTTRRCACSVAPTPEDTRPFTVTVSSGGEPHTRPRYPAVLAVSSSERCCCSIRRIS